MCHPPCPCANPTVQASAWDRLSMAVFTIERVLVFVLVPAAMVLFLFSLPCVGLCLVSMWRPTSSPLHHYPSQHTLCLRHSLMYTTPASHILIRTGCRPA
jgi:hypothetical protein